MNIVASQIGKSRTNSSSDIPPAKYSRMSYTVIRVPLIQGLPLRMAGSIAMRSSRFMGLPFLRCAARHVPKRRAKPFAGLLTPARRIQHDDGVLPFVDLVACRNRPCLERWLSSGTLHVAYAGPTACQPARSSKNPVLHLPTGKPRQIRNAPAPAQRMAPDERYGVNDRHRLLASPQS